MAFKQPRPKGLTRELVEQFLTVLGDGSCPFVAITADRIGVKRSRVEQWVRLGEMESEDENSLEFELAQRSRKIQGDWKAAAMADLQNTTRDNAESAKQTAWLLQRLDRENFDISRPAKNAPKGETSRPAHVKDPLAARDARDAAARLEKTEDQLQ